MSHFRVNRNQTPRELRWFGLLLPIFVALAGAIARWRFEAPTAALGIWSAGGALAALYWVAPSLRRQILVGWMYAALPIGWTVSHLMMGVVYFAVVTPIGLVSRLVRGDTLQPRDRPRHTHLLDRTPAAQRHAPLPASVLSAPRSHCPE